MTTQIQSDLLNMGNKRDAEFIAKLIPTIPANTIIGIKTPVLKQYIKHIENTDIFVDTLPHKYFEENQLHAFILSQMRDFEQCIFATNKFLPFIDNWATCDQLRPKCFAKHLDELLPFITKWIKSKHIYTVRFAIGMLMSFYLGDKFNLKYADMVAGIKTDEYYLKMMQAWYFATALYKNWDDIIPILKTKQLDSWTHNKTIQKARESLRITKAQKEYLGKLKV